MVDFLYDHIVARRWIYSVIRHQAQAEWTNYRHAPVDENLVRDIAQSLKEESQLFPKIRDRQGANHTGGGDVWYRITAKSTNSKEYQFVISRLPESVQAKLAKSARMPSKNARKSKPAQHSEKPQPQSGCGCLLLALMAAAVLAVGYNVLQQ